MQAESNLDEKLHRAFVKRKTFGVEDSVLLNDMPNAFCRIGGYSFQLITNRIVNDDLGFRWVSQHKELICTGIENTQIPMGLTEIQVYDRLNIDKENIIPINKQWNRKIGRIASSCKLTVNEAKSLRDYKIGQLGLEPDAKLAINTLPGEIGFLSVSPYGIKVIYNGKDIKYGRMERNKLFVLKDGVVAELRADEVIDMPGLFKHENTWILVDKPIDDSIESKRRIRNLFRIFGETSDNREVRAYRWYITVNKNWEVGVERFDN